MRLKNCSPYSSHCNYNCKAKPCRCQSRPRTPGQQQEPFMKGWMDFSCMDRLMLFSLSVNLELVKSKFSKRLDRTWEIVKTVTLSRKDFEEVSHIIPWIIWSSSKSDGPAEASNNPFCFCIFQRRLKITSRLPRHNEPEGNCIVVDYGRDMKVML